jgi:1,4-dihydroxy-2-naphthoate polyprenyltransferase
LQIGVANLKNPGPAEPSATALAGRDPFRVICRYFQATRPRFLTASILPVLVGTSWGYRAAGELNLAVLLLALAAIVCVQASINLLNDVFDELSGNDRLNAERIYPYTGGSRFIQNGVLSIRAMALWAIALLLLAALFGALLMLEKGLTVLLFGLVGVALGVLYSAPPLQLSARGLGEAAVAIGFGCLPVAGAAWLQSSESALGALLLSLPISCWVMAILLINEVPDRAADAATGKRTLVVRLGLGKTAMLYGLLQALALASIALLLRLYDLHPVAFVVPALLLVPAIYAALGVAAAQPRLKRSIEMTLMIHMLGALWLAGWLLVSA